MTRVHVLVAGLGNIGSAAAAHVCRLAPVGRVSLVDRDRYDRSNLARQEIDSRAVGRLKAEVQAERLIAIRPGLAIEPISAALEDLPLGRLRADAILSCLDSRAARRTVNEAALRLGVPWIDAGIRPEANLARVTVYVPGSEFPCLECAWGPLDYAGIDDVAACGAAAPRATGGASFQGALAAALQSLELARLLEGAPLGVRAGREVIVDPVHDVYLVSRHGRNRGCLVPHARWHIEPLPAEAAALTVNDLAERARGAGAVPHTLAVAGRVFARAVVCRRGGHRLRLERFTSRAGGEAEFCARCGGALLAAGPDAEHALRLGNGAGPDLGARTLAALGVRAGDVLTLEGERGLCRFELPIPDRWSVLARGGARRRSDLDAN